MGRSSVTELLVMREQEACTKDDKKLILSLLAHEKLILKTQMRINKRKLIYMYKHRIWESLGKFSDLWLLILVVHIDFLFGHIHNFKSC